MNRFLLPQLHLEALATQQNLRAMMDKSRALPSSPDDSYRQTLERVKVQSKIAENCGLRTLAIVLHATRRLTVPELQHALATHEGDPEFDEDGLQELLHCTGGFLTILKDPAQSEHGTVQFAHTTIEQFLLLEGKEAFMDAEERLAVICMTYLQFHNFAKASVRWAEPNKRFPFLRYAALNVGYHCTQAIEGGCTSMLPKVQAFTERIPIGSWQIVATKVIQRPTPDRVELWTTKTTKLHQAVTLGMDTVVKKYLATREFDCEAIAEWKEETPLHMAARSASINATKLLLAHHVNINATSWSGKTALDCILHEPYLRVVRRITETNLAYILISQLIQLHRSIARDQSPFDCRGEIERNVAFGLDCKLKTSEGVKELAMVLADERKGERFGLKMILASGLALDISDEQEELAKLLIEAGADVNAVGIPEVTPLQLAAVYGRVDLVKYLLRHKANPFLRRGFGYTPLEIADQRANHMGNDLRYQRIKELLTTDMGGRARLENQSLTEAERLGMDKHVSRPDWI